MARIKLETPTHFTFSTEIQVRIDDINYGNHMSNDAYLKFMHEARLRFFEHYGYSEINLAGVSVIMGDTAIVFKGECFYGDVLLIEVTITDIGQKSFDLFYRFTKKSTQKLVCEAKIGMVCFDYNARKTVDVPAAFKQHFIPYPTAR